MTSQLTFLRIFVFIAVVFPMTTMYLLSSTVTKNVVEEIRNKQFLLELEQEQKIFHSKELRKSHAIETLNGMVDALTVKDKQLKSRYESVLAKFKEIEDKNFPLMDTLKDNSALKGKKTTKEYFEIADYADSSFEQMMADYCVFHKQMIDGEIPPRYVLSEISSSVEPGEGFGNRVERVVWTFFFSLLTGRSFLLKFVDIYDISKSSFAGPCFDWNYHESEEFQQLPKTSLHFQNPKLQSAHLPTAYGSDIPVIHLHSYQRTFNTPGASPFINPHYRHVIPKVLGNWKSTLLHWLFSNPSPEIVGHVQDMKNKIKSAGYSKILSIQFRSWGYTQAVRSWDIDRYIDCAKVLTKNEPEWAFFLATDNQEIKSKMKSVFGEQLFSMDVKVYGPNDGEFQNNKQYEKDMKISGTVGVVVDWLMLGEGDYIMHTAASSYGISAADRGGHWKYPNRFVMGGLTQCTDSNGEYYMEKIYKSPLETYEEKGFIDWIPFIQ